MNRYDKIKAIALFIQGTELEEIAHQLNITLEALQYAINKQG